MLKMNIMKFNYSNKIKSCAFIFFTLLLVLVNGCKKDSKTKPELETSTLTDIDGNVYKTVKIGNRWWMAENLKVKTYRNGNTIPKIQSDTAQWKSDTTGAYCIYDNNSNTPGLLYNWYSVNNTNQIAPVGWHIPSDDEWKELEKQLGMSSTEADKTSWRGTDQGEKLKIESPNGWTKSGDIWSTNESGFTALAGGCRMFDGRWGDPGLFATGFWWSTSVTNNQAWYRYLDYKNANVFRYYGLKTYGFSVRCIKD
jgi:uncharacterized protein (TIGR02145 family)